jgi:hypothetical protein
VTQSRRNPIAMLAAMVFAVALAISMLAMPSALAQELPGPEDCPEEFPLCPEGEGEGDDDGGFEDDEGGFEDDDGGFDDDEGGFEDDGGDFEDDGGDFDDDGGFDDGGQVSETPEGGVAAGAGGMAGGSGSTLLLLGLAGAALGAGALARRRLA